MKNEDIKKNWQSPWSYRESFAVAAIIMFVAYFFEWLTGGNIQMPSHPLNIVILVVYIGLMVWLYVSDRDTVIVKWLRSVPAAIASVALLAVQVIIMGILPQQYTDANIGQLPLGLHRVMNSWPFALSIVFLLTVLGQITLHRCIPLRLKNLPFILNHLGLWIALAIGTIGSGDIQRLSMTLHDGEIENRASDGIYFRKLDFALRLDSFVMETYPPKLMLHTEGKQTDRKACNNLRAIELNDSYNLGKYNVSIVEYFENAVNVGSNYIQAEQYGAAPAVRVRVQGVELDTLVWLSCGSFAVLPQLLQISPTDVLVMLEPEAKRFESHVVIFNNKEDHGINAVIEVNKPLNVNGWKVYQTSYDVKAGKYSTVSKVELVRDLWINFVYLGFFMMMLGAIYMIVANQD